MPFRMLQARERQHHRSPIGGRLLIDDVVVHVELCRCLSELARVTSNCTACSHDLGHRGEEEKNCK